MNNVLSIELDFDAAERLLMVDSPNEVIILPVLHGCGHAFHLRDTWQNLVYRVRSGYYSRLRCSDCAHTTWLEMKDRS